MRNMFPEYIEYTDKEKEKLWEECIFVFDTNVLLNLYRYSKSTRDTLLLALDSLKDRIWIPYNVADEFLKNRCCVIYEYTEKYKQLKKDGKSFVEKIRVDLRLKEDDKDIIELDESISKWLDEEEQKNLLVKNPQEDMILKNILESLNNHVGEALSENELKEIEAEGEKRYAQNIPPGYKDRQKKDGEANNNQFGDLIIWKEILKYSRNNKKDIIFVTQDAKEDWWHKVAGKNTGPRYELKKEFIRITSQKFHMYTVSLFLQFFEKNNESGFDKNVLENAIKEIDTVSKFAIKPTFNFEDKIDMKSLTDYKIKLDTNIDSYKIKEIPYSVDEMKIKKDLSARDIKLLKTYIEMINLQNHNNNEE